MKRMVFDSQGKLVGVDEAQVSSGRGRGGINENGEEGGFGELKKNVYANVEEEKDVKDSEYWSLYKNGKKLEPLKFSNEKTQEDVVREVVEAVKGGNKLIFLHGMCGTGKSAIALNIARVLGKAAIIVPVKSLQRQYEEDYMEKMKVFKKNGKSLKIAMITGRDNHDSVFQEGVSCADPFLPDTIQIVEKNFNKLRVYYEMNPLVKSKTIDDVKQLRRISIAPTNPYWSPIIPAEFEMPLRDAVKKRYKGLKGKEFIFYHRKKGCTYYDQFQSYIDADVIIFNSAKYKIEVALDRKPATEIDIIDEADEFLDGFSNQIELNLTRLDHSLRGTFFEDENARSAVDTIREIIKLEEKRIGALGVNEMAVYHIKDTGVEKILSLFNKNPGIEVEICTDDLNYANKGVEAARQFSDFIDDTYLTYRRYEDNLFVNLVTTNLSKKLQEIIDKNKTFVFMSGTLHSEAVLKNIFGIKNYMVVEAETLSQGEVEILRTGKEFDCSYKNFKMGNANREMYLKALDVCISRTEKPTLVHVNAFEDLPTRIEIGNLGLVKVMPRENFIELQGNDKTGRLISLFKKGMSDFLYSTKCSRGVDFPGDMCRSVVFTKYPNPNVQGTFWKVLERTHSQYFWDFYKDKARREFLQRLYRALRSKDDHVYVLSPDSRVLDAVRELQLGWER